MCVVFVKTVETLPLRDNRPHSCAMDGGMKSAGSRGEHVSWIAGPARSCISLVLVVMKTSHFTRWAQKTTAVQSTALLVE